MKLNNLISLTVNVVASLCVSYRFQWGHLKPSGYLGFSGVDRGARGAEAPPPEIRISKEP